MISNNIVSYVKTTETCNLNCKHCFTSGSSGKKIFFNPDRTADFFVRLKRDFPNIQYCNFIFHGGEPLLAPPKDIIRFHDLTKNIFEQSDHSIQTNLVYKLTEDRTRVLDLFDSFGTSWDYDIRFESVGNKKTNLELWESNVKTLLDKGKYLTMIVSITDRMVKELQPLEIINYAISLGFQNILFERITESGNTLLNSHIRPSNLNQSDWIKKMWDQTFEYKLYEKINNMLLSEIATAMVHREHVSNRCRNCEQSLITINADGTIGGCPNNAPSKNWGHIDWRVVDSIKNPIRMKEIACEISRNPACASCPVNSYCNGDCHNLPWEDDICGSPKSLFMKLAQEKDFDSYKKLIL